MKILMLIDSVVKGGKERRMLELIKGLLASGEPVSIMLISFTDQVEYDYVYDLPIEFIVFDRKIKWDVSIISKLRALVKSFQPDIIHSWSTMASVYMLFAKSLTKAPFINGFIADAPQSIPKLGKYYWRIKLTSFISDAFVGNSLAGINVYKTPRDRTYCIYNGVDFKRFDNLQPPAILSENMQELSDEKSIVIAMVAVFSHRKDYETLIEAAIELCKKNERLYFMLIGDGPTLIQNQRKVIDSNLEKQIQFLGKRNNVESLLQLADIGVLITHGEGISNSIIEYMALGLPVIASKGGGTNELIEDGRNGFLIDPENKDQLVQKITLLLNDSNLMKSMGAYAYNWVRKTFDVHIKTKEYKNLYNKLLSGS